MEGESGETEKASSLEATCALLEQRHVHDVYEKTAHHFRDTNYKAWPKVKQFLKSLEPGSLVADIGCGTGRYMNINGSSFKLGSDHCSHLVEIARDHGHEVMVCDNLRLPYRNNCFDTVISIAVIHHLTTPERRLVAVQELARILRPGGKLMIYVWAMEQRHRKFKSQDVLVPWHMKTKHQQQREKTKLKIEMERSSTNSISEDEGDSTRNSHKHPPVQGERATGSYLRMCTESPPPSESTDSGFDNSPRTNRETGAPSSTKVDKNVSGNEENLSPYDQKKTGTVTVPSDKLTQRSLQRRAGIPSRLRQHLRSLFKGHVALQEEVETAISPKDLAYKKLMHKIMQEQGGSFPFHHHVLEHSLSDPSIEGFAVREFPQSSRTRFASTDEVPRQSDSCSMPAGCDQVRTDAFIAQDEVEGDSMSIRIHQLENGICYDANSKSISCAYQKDVDQCGDVVSSLSFVNKLSGIKTAMAFSREWTSNGVCKDVVVVDSCNQAVCSGQNGSDDVFDAPDIVLEDDIVQGNCSGNVERSPQGELNQTLCGSYHDNASVEDVLSTAQTLSVAKESILISAPVSPHSTGSSWGDSSDLSCGGDTSCVDDSYETIIDVVRSTAENDVTNTSEDCTNSCQDEVISSVSNDISQVDISNGVTNCDDGIGSDDDIIHMPNEGDASTGDVNGIGRTSSVSRRRKAPSLSCCENLPSDDYEWARTTEQAIEAIQTQVLRAVGNLPDACGDRHQMVLKGMLHHQLNGHHVTGSRMSSTSSDICSESSTDDDTGEGFLNRVTAARTADSTTDGNLPGAVDNSRDHSLDSADSSDTFKRFYHVFREGELVELIENHVDCLDVMSACYDHANWCVIAEKVQVWKI